MSMAIDKVKTYLAQFGRDKDVREFEVSSATVDLAAKALGVEEARIAKTLSFYDKDGGCILIVAAGDARVDGTKFKKAFGMKPKMPKPEDAERMTGHAVGGICPFANPEGVSVWLDSSLRRFETVYPACGSSNSGIELTCDELYQYSKAAGWADVTKL